MELDLKPWQKLVFDMIGKHDDLTNGESMMSLSTYDVNKATQISVTLPYQSGHSTLVCYTALKYPSMIIYKNLNDLDNILDTCDATVDDLKKAGSETMSWYELLYYVNMGPQSDSQERDVEFQNIKKRIENKKVVLVDHGSKVQRNFSQLIDFLFVISKGAVVLLG
jgi:hypothetical protein